MALRLSSAATVGLAPAGVGAVGDHGVTGRAQTPAVQERIGEVYAEQVAPLLVSGRLELPVECLFVEAVNADR